METWANSVNCKIVTSNIGHRVCVINEKKNVNQEEKKQILRLAIQPNLNTLLISSK